MLAGLLYFIGLVTVLVNLALAGYQVPAAITELTQAMDTGTTDMVVRTTVVAARFLGYAMPLLAGLLLMGFGRVIMLLSSINRSLRGQG